MILCALLAPAIACTTPATNSCLIFDTSSPQIFIGRNQISSPCGTHGLNYSWISHPKTELRVNSPWASRRTTRIKVVPQSIRSPFSTDDPGTVFPHDFFGIEWYNLGMTGLESGNLFMIVFRGDAGVGPIHRQFECSFYTGLFPRFRASAN